MSGQPRIRLVVLALLSASVIVLPTTARQYDLRQAPGTTTTDDPRWVPIPPRDRSKDPVLLSAQFIDGDPLPHIENLRKTGLVIADGRVLRDKTSGRETTSASRP